MNESEVEKLIERSLSAGRPREAFRARLLGDSTAALARSTRRRARWRKAGLAAAAVLIVGFSFLGGRLSAPRPQKQSAEVVVRTTPEPGGVTVPDELVAWLEAARLFRQLGMEDRMALAVDRAGSQLPRYTATAGNPMSASVAAAGRDVVEEPSAPVRFPVLTRVLASTGSYKETTTTLGGYDHAIGTD
jgi:hypothetical protein